MTPVTGGSSGPSRGRFSATARVARHPGVLCRELDGETILLDPESGTYYALNEVGSRVWDLVAEAPTVAEVLRRLADEYAVDEERLARDVEALLDRLLAEGLVELAGGATGGGAA